jgi:hypothetical protein
VMTASVEVDSVLLADLQLVRTVDTRQARLACTSCVSHCLEGRNVGFQRHRIVTTSQSRWYCWWAAGGPLGSRSRHLGIKRNLPMVVLCRSRLVVLQKYEA